MFAILERLTLFLSSWLGKSYILVAGVIHILREDQYEDEEWTKVKLVAIFDGPWCSHINAYQLSHGGSWTDLPHSDTEYVLIT